MSTESALLVFLILLVVFGVKGTFILIGVCALLLVIFGAL